MRKSTVKWRFSIYKQDNYACAVCGEDDIQHLEAHHILPQRTHPELSNELWNGITLCQLCHCQTWTKELEMAPYFFALIKNGANSVKTLPSKVEGNPELNIEGNLYKCVTTRRRILKRLRKFFRKKIPCTECGKDVLMHFFRIKNIKHHFCSKECKSGWMKRVYGGKGNPNYKEPKIIRCLYCNKETQTPTDLHRIKNTAIIPVS